MPVVIHTQYVKDVSFENPNSPETLRPGKAAPEMDINISMDAKKIEEANPDENLFEVVLKLGAKATREDKAMFLAEIDYAALVSLPGVAKENHHPLLLIEVPKVIFPFARQLLAELTQSGGYPPLLLNPVDFRTLYIEQFGAENQDQKEQVSKEA